MTKEGGADAPKRRRATDEQPGAKETSDRPWQRRRGFEPLEPEGSKPPDPPPAGGGDGQSRN
jgi:hypothetical protein